MKERINKLVGDNVGKHLWVGTFHALCARLLREFGEKIGLDRDFVVYDDADQMTLMKECMRQLNIDEKKFAPRALLSRISAAKEKLVRPPDWHKHFMGFIDDIAGKALPRLPAKTARQQRAGFRRPAHRSRPCYCRSAKTCWNACKTASATSWWTSIRT